MTAFLKIDECQGCLRRLPWEWLPAVFVNGKALAGTGVWCSPLMDGLCPTCLKTEETRRWEKGRALAQRAQLIELLGGEKPFRELTFERYNVSPGNRLAYEKSNSFNPASDNLYLWGPCGVGKTHLAWAAARRCFEETLTVEILRGYQISRKIRMRDPSEAQSAIAQLINADALIIDDLGTGVMSAFACQIIHEFLDGRDLNGRSGLIVTSKYSLDQLAAHFEDDSIPSRLAGLCRIIQVHGTDYRLAQNRHHSEGENSDA